MAHRRIPSSQQKQQERRQSAHDASNPPEQDVDNAEAESAQRLMVERLMSRLLGDGRGGEPSAEDLAYLAMEAANAGQAEQVIELIEQALELDPGCVDALLLLAQIGSASRKELIDNTTRTVEVAEHQLGEDAFETMRGDFWGFHETRPYMRARAFLAEVLAASARRDEAIKHYEQMLDLNPGDNQGLRYPLMGLYLSQGNLEGARWLFEQYEDEGSAVFAWSRVLERFLAGKEDEAEAALGEARNVNPHVEPMLLDNRKISRRRPAYYGVGDENEAIQCADSINSAWRRNRKAIQWLKQQK